MDMPSLVTASVDLNDKEAQFDANDMQEFLQSLSRVKQLKFRYNGEEVCLLIWHVPLFLLYLRIFIYVNQYDKIWDLRPDRDVLSGQFCK